MGLDSGEIYEKNMVVLEEKHKPLWERIKAHEPSLMIEVFYNTNSNSAGNKPNLKVTKEDGSVHYLHDQDDPEKEVPLFLEMVSEDANGVVLLTGMGLGYTPKAILEHRKKIRYLILFDLILDVFYHALHYMDLTSMLADPRLILSFGPDQDIEKTFGPANLVLQLESIHHLKHMPSFALDEEKYEIFSDDVYKKANQYSFGGGALLGGGKAYTRNRFANMFSMYNNNILQDLQGKFKNIPAVLVAGGPSLDENIHLLPSVKNRAVIIAVDSALPNLVVNGVPADFMTAIDPYDLIYEKFANALPGMENTALIASTWVAPKVPKIFPPDKVFWSFSGRNMENWIMAMMGGTLPTGGASTVAHLNLVAALLMGCSPIIFVGQDLAYSKKSTHAANTALTQNQAAEKFLKSKDLMWTEGIHGGKVPTDQFFTNYKDYFEHLIATNPGTYINSTAQGAHIKGTRPMAFEDVVEKYCTVEHDIGAVVSSIKNNRTSRIFLTEFQAFKKDSKVLIGDVDKADVLQKKVIKTLTKKQGQKRKYKAYEALTNAQKKQIGQIDKKHGRIDRYQKVWGILDEVTMAGLQKSERLKYEVKLLEGKPDKYSEWLLKNLERLNLINAVRKRELTEFTGNLSKLMDYFEQENELINRIKADSKNKDHQNILSLAGFYLDAGEFSMVEHLCNQYGDDMGENTELEFYKACVALMKNRFELAEDMFQTMAESSPELEDKIVKFRKKISEKYLDHANHFKVKDENTVRRMLIKGLKYGGNQPQLSKKVNEMAEADLQKSLDFIESNQFSNASQILGKWVHDMDMNPVLAQSIEAPVNSEFYKLYASRLVGDGKFDEALPYFDKAISIIDDKPEYHLLKADACFAANDNHNGRAALSKAVSLDGRYARYWETMGDNLVNKGALDEALAAYEQFFNAAPDKNYMTLKKISQCYQQMGLLEEARQALLMLKERLS